MNMILPLVVIKILLFVVSVVYGFSPATTLRNQQNRLPTICGVASSSSSTTTYYGDDNNNNSNSRKKQHSISFDAIKGKTILVVGGSGRVGGSVVTQLIKRGATAVTVGGTKEESYALAKKRWQELIMLRDDEDDKENSNRRFQTSINEKVSFETLHREQASSVASVLARTNYDLVVHTAGPFQGKARTPNGVIDACISMNVPYIDVCDDYCTATSAKTKYSQPAQEAQVPCIISTGCWPGVSSLMAKQLARKVLATNNELKPEDLTVNFNFFTAGSGGAGATLLVATFLILAEEALTVVNGRRRPVKAMKDYSMVNFGSIVGDKPIAHLNLLETASIHDVLGIGNVKALFGTAPGFWNTLLGVMAQLPSSLLANEDVMSKLATFSLPIVRLVDYFAGATNAMRVDVTSEKAPDVCATAIYAHENLEPCVGECVVAFCCAVLSNKVPPGVWFPEEAIKGGDDAVAVLFLSSVEAHTKEVDGSDGIGLSLADVWGYRFYDL